MGDMVKCPWFVKTAQAHDIPDDPKGLGLKKGDTGICRGCGLAYEISSLKPLKVVRDVETSTPVLHVIANGPPLHPEHYIAALTGKSLLDELKANVENVGLAMVTTYIPRCVEPVVPPGHDRVLAVPQATHVDAADIAADHNLQFGHKTDVVSRTAPE